MSSKKKLNNKDLIKILSISIFVVVAVVGLAIAFLLNYNGFSPAKPSIIYDGKNIFLTAPINDSYEGYRFKFEYKEDKIILDSSVNIISTASVIEKGAKLGQTYDVSVCYLGKKAGNNSEFSQKIKWTCSIYLNAPNIVYDNETNFITWQDVENADYYQVFVNGIADPYKVEETSFDLKEIDGGERTIYVVAYSEQNGYLTSRASNIVEVEVIKILKGFSSISFDYTDKVVTAISEERYESVELLIGSSRYEIKQFSVVEEEDTFVYKISIDKIYNNEDLIGILPKDIDEYNQSNKDDVRYCRVEFPEESETQ